MQRIYLKSKFILVIETYSRNMGTVTRILDDNKFEFQGNQPFPSMAKFEVLCTLKSAEILRQLLLHSKIELL